MYAFLTPTATLANLEDHHSPDPSKHSKAPEPETNRERTQRSSHKSQALNKEKRVELEEPARVAAYLTAGAFGLHRNLDMLKEYLPLVKKTTSFSPNSSGVTSPQKTSRSPSPGESEPNNSSSEIDSDTDSDVGPDWDGESRSSVRKENLHLAGTGSKVDLSTEREGPNRRLTGPNHTH